MLACWLFSAGPGLSSDVWSFFNMNTGNLADLHITPIEAFSWIVGLNVFQITVELS